MTLEFETTPHVCAECGSDEWLHNTFYLNKTKEWHDDPDFPYYCDDCGGGTEIIPQTKYEEVTQ